MRNEKGQFIKGERPFNYKDGRDSTRIYQIWLGIKQRCENPKRKAYPRYGGRGIKCSWRSFDEFFADMGGSYKDGLTIDRVDTNGNYYKENCRWATYLEQNHNRKSTIYLTYKNQTKTLKEWSVDVGIAYKTLFARRSSGWKPEEIIQTPLGAGFVGENVKLSEKKKGRPKLTNSL